MAFELVPVKNQKFEWGRTINPFKCDCKECTFMNCPKRNYAVKMKKKIWKVKDFWTEFKDDILALNKPKRWEYTFHDHYDLELNYRLINEFVDMLFSFPKGTYWSPDDYKLHDDNTDIDDVIYRSIKLQKLSRSGNIINLGEIAVKNGKYFDYDLSATQEKLVIKMSRALNELKELMFSHYQERDKEWKVGWLSREGRHYPCSHCEHFTLAHQLGHGEIILERDGWVKVFCEGESGYFCNRRLLTAEQRNWLSLNGYLLED